jgi:hypothetical protein
MAKKQKRQLKSIAYKKEPFLSAIHRYVAVIGKLSGGVWRSKYFYLKNRDEVRALCKKQAHGTVIEVYKATHNFHAGMMKVSR